MYQLAYNKLALIGAAAARIYAEAGAAERQRLLHRLNDFASTLEHEIRNPLNTAVVTSELLRKDEIAQQRRAVSRSPRRRSLKTAGPHAPRS